MSEIKVDNLTGKTTATTVTGPDLFKTDELQGKTTAGDITVTSEGGAATQSLQQGLAKMWAQINQSSFSILDSINVSSASDDGTGVFTVTKSNNMSNSNYAVATASMGDRVGLLGSDGNNFTTSQNNFTLNDSRNAAFADWDRNCIVATGDLA